MYFTSIVCMSMEIRENWRKEVAHLPAPARCGGFTLIELSIVLVVIGLLVGGVVVGRDMIEIAKARSLMAQMQNFEVAYNAFRLKYNCIPGDCKKAANFGLGDSGNGDNLIGVNGSATGQTGCLNASSHGCVTTRAFGWDTSVVRPWYEMQDIWVHLSNAGLIPGSFNTMTSSNNPGASTSYYGPLDTYFPKSATGKSHLVPFMWNSRIYVRTGVIGMNSHSPLLAVGSWGNRDRWSEGALTGVQMRYIHNKLGYSVIVGSSNAAPYGSGWPNAAVEGQRVFASEKQTNGGNTVVYIWWTPGVCFNGTGTDYNLSASGYCDLLWQIN